jgi:type IX secretion system PorP/SprF family membrane protein
MKLKHIVGMILLAGLFFAKEARAQQNIQFTQYIFNSLSVNPAYAGYKEEWFGQLALRSQWQGLEGAPKTGQASIDGILDPGSKRHGLGFQVSADKMGPQSATSVYANYAFRLRLDDMDTKRLSFGIGVGASQYGLNGAMLDPIEGDDPTILRGNESVISPDLRFGVHYSSPSWYAGLSVMDLLSGDKSNSIFKYDNGNMGIARKRHLYLIAGALIDLDNDLKLRPSILVKEDFKGPTSLDLNAMFIFADRFWVGAGYRTGMTLWEKDYQQGQNLSKLNSVSAIGQFYVNERLRIGYSYDYILSELSSLQNGTHEITLGLTFPQKGRRILSPRYF